MYEGEHGEQVGRGSVLAVDQKVAAAGAGRRIRRTGTRIRTGRWDAWLIARLGLLATFVVLIGGIWLGGVKHTSYNDLRGDIAAGRTQWVGVTGGLPAGAEGDAMVLLQWSAGHHRNYARVTEVSGAGSGTISGTDPVVYGDLAAQLQALAPQHDLQVQRSGFTLGTEIAGWQVPDWVSAVAMLMWLATFAVLIGGPQPRFATRWGWFWAIAMPLNFVGLPLFLLMGQPWGQALEFGLTKERRRVNGFISFLLVGVLGSLLGFTFSR